MPGPDGPARHAERAALVSEEKFSRAHQDCVDSGVLLPSHLDEVEALRSAVAPHTTRWAARNPRIVVDTPKEAEHPA
jgi:hypothetical protein